MYIHYILHFTLINKQNNVKILVIQVTIYKLIFKHNQLLIFALIKMNGAKILFSLQNLVHILNIIIEHHNTVKTTVTMKNMN